MSLGQQGPSERDLKLQQKEAARQHRQMQALMRQMAKPVAAPAVALPPPPKLPAVPPPTEVLTDGSADPTEEARKRAQRRFGLGKTRVAGALQAASMGGALALGNGDTVLGG